jgi:hypothetical protein
MAWRKIQVEDIKRGTIIRMLTMQNDGAYHMATIISVNEEDPRYKHVKVARPYAYANENFNAKEPLLGAEVFAIGFERLLAPSGDYEVFQGRDNIRSMVT